MKTKLALLLAALSISSAASGQQQAAPPLVSTTGSAEIRVVPDLADLSFQVETRSADLAVARKQQAERAVKLLAALRAAGIPEVDLQTSQVEISPDYSNNRSETDKVRFYRVVQSFSCTLHDVKQVPDMTATAVAAGATDVQQAVLRTSQLRKYRDEARAKAIRAAKEKATALAEELGAKVGKPHTIMEGASYSGRAAFMNNGNFAQVQSQSTEAAGDEGSASFAPGTISISASVSVSFLLE